jgi:hypothetical protein
MQLRSGRSLPPAAAAALANAVASGDADLPAFLTPGQSRTVPSPSPPLSSHLDLERIWISHLDQLRSHACFVSFVSWFVADTHTK